jgi:hypothetical protein
MFQTNLPQRGFKFACAATFFTPDMGEPLVQMPQLNELLPKVTSGAIPHPTSGLHKRIIQQTILWRGVALPSVPACSTADGRSGGRPGVPW